MQLNIPYINANYRIFCGRLHKLYCIYEVEYYFKLTQTTMHEVSECSLDLDLNMTTHIKDVCI